MPKYTYPLVRYKYVSPEDGSCTYSPLQPSVPIRLTNPVNGKKSIITYALLDTGADGCLFSGDIAEKVGHSLQGRGVKSKVNIGIGQFKLAVYKHSFRIELLCPEQKDVVWTSEPLLIDCSDAEPMVILGMDEFLKNFKITFDYPNEEVTLEW